MERDTVSRRSKKIVSMRHTNHQSGSFESFTQLTLSTSGSVFSPIFDPFCSLSGGSERNGIKSTLIFCRGCGVWVTRITQGGGETMEKSERYKKKRRSSGVEEWNVESALWSPPYIQGCDSFILRCIFGFTLTLTGDEGPPLYPITDCWDERRQFKDSARVY